MKKPNIYEDGLVLIIFGETSNPISNALCDRINRRLIAVGADSSKVASHSGCGKACLLYIGDYQLVKAAFLAEIDQYNKEMNIYFEKTYPMFYSEIGRRANVHYGEPHLERNV